MFSFNYEQRLATWSKFREQLETSKDPLQDVIDFYKHCPQVSRHTDPYDPEVWPNPWELIHENEYCDYCIILAMCYTLQLTERFSQSKFEIINSTNIETGETFQYLKVDNMVLQPMEGVVKNVSECPSTWISQRIYDMQKPH